MLYKKRLCFYIHRITFKGGNIRKTSRGTLTANRLVSFLAVGFPNCTAVFSSLGLNLMCFKSMLTNYNTHYIKSSKMMFYICGNII